MLLVLQDTCSLFVLGACRIAANYTSSDPAKLSIHGMLTQLTHEGISQNSG